MHSPEQDSHEGSAPRTGAVLAVAALVAVGIWLLFLRGDDDSGSSQVEGEAAAVVEQADLVALSEDLGQPIYWAGPQEGTALELTHLENGRLYVRYLTDGAEPGDARPDFLTVATYPYPDAYGALEKVARRDGSTRLELAGGLLAVSNRASPTSVYLAREGEDFQVEVYDPDPERALSLATTGQVEPVR